MAFSILLRVLCVAACIAASGCAELGFPALPMADAEAAEGGYVSHSPPPAPSPPVEETGTDASDYRATTHTGEPEFRGAKEGLDLPTEWQGYRVEKWYPCGRAEWLDEKFLTDAAIALSPKAPYFYGGILFARHERCRVHAFDFDGEGAPELAVLRETEPGSHESTFRYHASAAREIVAKCDEILARASEACRGEATE